MTVDLRLTAAVGAALFALSLPAAASAAGCSASALLPNAPAFGGAAGKGAVHVASTPAQMAAGLKGGQRRATISRLRTNGFRSGADRQYGGTGRSAMAQVEVLGSAAAARDQARFDAARSRPSRGVAPLPTGAPRGAWGWVGLSPEGRPVALNVWVAVGPRVLYAGAFDDGSSPATSVLAELRAMIRAATAC